MTTCFYSIPKIYCRI